jgi:hypothetical protein
MACCSPANQNRAKTKTTQGNDRYASESVIVIGDDLVCGSAKEAPQLKGNERPLDAGRQSRVRRFATSSA